MSHNDWFVYCQEWERSRIDSDPTIEGFSLHFSLDDLHIFIEQHWAKMPKDIPEEYLRPYGDPYVCKIELSKYESVLAQDYGKMFSGKPPLPLKGGN
jgi:hypothetical protein